MITCAAVKKQVYKKEQPRWQTKSLFKSNHVHHKQKVNHQNVAVAKWQTIGKFTEAMVCITSTSCIHNGDCLYYKQTACSQMKSRLTKVITCITNKNMLLKVIIWLANKRNASECISLNGTGKATAKTDLRTPRRRPWKRGTCAKCTRRSSASTGPHCGSLPSIRTWRISGSLFTEELT